MLIGLLNTLQCSEREAVRIALYESSKSIYKAYESAFIYATSESTEKGHQGRSSSKQWNLPKAEQIAATNAANELGITGAEFVRLSIIWLQQGIRKDEIRSIQNCKIISSDKAAHQWSKENHGKPASEQVASLKKALNEAQQLINYMDEIKADERDARKKERRTMTWSTQSAIDQEIADFNAAQEQWFNDLWAGGSIEDIQSQMAFSFMRRWKVDWDTAFFIVQDDFLDKRDPKKMKPMDKLRLIKMGRAKAAKPEDDERAKKQRREEIREEKDREWRAYIESFPKNWGAYVMSQRVCMRMIGQPDPFPDLPNPLPRDFPMPEDWNSEHVSTDFQKDDRFYG